MGEKYFKYTKMPKTYGTYFNITMYEQKTNTRVIVYPVAKDYALKRLSKGWVVECNVQVNVRAYRMVVVVMHVKRHESVGVSSAVGLAGSSCCYYQCCCTYQHAYPPTRLPARL